MRMNRNLVIPLALLAALALTAAAAFAVDAPADMEITVPEGATATKSPVAFSHTGHAALDCQACHHKWDGASPVQGCATDGCHTDVAAKKGDDSFYMAFHDRGSETSCVGCHFALKKAGSPTGPVSCNDCHPK